MTTEWTSFVVVVVVFVLLLLLLPLLEWWQWWIVADRVHNIWTVMAVAWSNSRRYRSDMP
jgi:hypothetical protein